MERRPKVVKVTRVPLRGTSPEDAKKPCGVTTWARALSLVPEFDPELPLRPCTLAEKYFPACAPPQEEKIPLSELPSAAGMAKKRQVGVQLLFSRPGTVGQTTH